MESGKLYSIGKISEMMGVSVQALRHWEKIGLFTPAYINQESGYRYYEYAQMHRIDRIRYLQSLGITLEEICKFYDSGKNMDESVEILCRQRDKTLKEIEAQQSRLEQLDWYIGYFSFLKDKKHVGIPYLKRFEERTALMVDMGEGVPFSVTNENFYRLRQAESYRNLKCHRQYVSVLDEKELRKGKNVTLQYGLYLCDGQEADRDDPHVFTFPAGEYLCFLARIYREDLWTPSIFDKHIEVSSHYLVIADEYEDNLEDFSSCIYEVRMIEA